MTPKPKMLFVDDRSKRIHSALRQYSEKYDVTIAPNVPEALRLLSNYNDWNVVSLDFDLNGHDFMDPLSPECGMEIIRYLQKTPWPDNKTRPRFIVHTSNAFAANLMYIELSKLHFTTEKHIFRYDEGAE